MVGSGFLIYPILYIMTIIILSGYRDETRFEAPRAA